MSDRGIKKWAPYKTLETQDFELKEHKEKEEKIEKPTISAEFAEEINEILVNYSGESLKIKYFKNGKILENYRPRENHCRKRCRDSRKADQLLEGGPA